MKNTDEISKLRESINNLTMAVSILLKTQSNPPLNKETPQDYEYYNTQRLAELTGYDHTYFSRAAKEGKIKSIRLGRKYLFTKEAVLEFLRTSSL